MIALVITIIVLLILAGVSVATLTGNNGLLIKTNEAKTESEISQAKEEIELALIKLEAMDDKSAEEKDNWLKEELKGATITRYESVDNIIISYKGCKFRVDSENNLQVIENLEEWDKTATPEDVFIWDEDEPGTVVGYTKKAKDYTTLKYPSRCTKIDYAWNNGSSYVTQVEKVEIPATVLTFGEAAFGGKSSSTTMFTGLKEVIIEKGVTSLATSMFRFNDSIQTVNIPEGVTKIRNQCFDDCGGILSIEIPDSVTTIGAYAFRECTSLTQVNIPNNVTSIGHMAFSGSTNIEKIVIPKSVVETAMEIFRGWGTGDTEQKIYVEAASMPSTWNRATFGNCSATLQYGYVAE